MLDLLLGAPGDTREGIWRTVELMDRELQPERAVISSGVRLYPGTPLAARLASPLLTAQPGLLGELEDNDNLLRPVFYLAPEVGPDLGAYLAELTRGNPRYSCPDPEAGLSDYNYSENHVLLEAIAAVYRGAFRDILRRREDHLPPA